jgi:hypothetical protein
VRKAVTLEDWRVAWSFLTDAVNAMIERDGLPIEDDLLAELLI